jgi:hypothetical protein
VLTRLWILLVAQIRLYPDPVAQDNPLKGSLAGKGTEAPLLGFLVENSTHGPAMKLKAQDLMSLLHPSSKQSQIATELESCHPQQI